MSSSNHSADSTAFRSQGIDRVAPRVVGIHAELFRLLRENGWPLFEFATRLWLAQLFFVSGLLKVTNWESALYLAANEYPVSWMDPVTAAYTGAAIELVAPIFFAAGLMTRYAALPMLLLSAVIQLNYIQLDNQLFWIAILGWYAVHGAGPIALDNLLRNGLADSAIPGIARIIKFSTWIRLRMTPLYLTALRVWIGLTLLICAGAVAGSLIDSGFPTASFKEISGVLALAAGGFFLAGFATRYVALILIGTVVGGAMMTAAAPEHYYPVVLFTLLIVHGAGWFSLDRTIVELLRSRYPEIDGKPAFALDGLPRVVIIGAGFAGLTCAKALRRVRVSVTLIDRANYHLFQPLLYQVATAGISPGDIAAPVRPLFRDAFNTRVLLGTVTGIDREAREVLIAENRLAYDFLLVASGATHSYFGKDEWQHFAPGLKRIEDAVEIRRRLLTAFEHAEATDDENERAALLTFLIVGGGPTGVELAGAIAELARYGMDREFRRFDPASARIVLVQSGARLLPAFDEKLATIANRSLSQIGVEVKVSSRVEHIDCKGVIVNSERIHARTVLWAAGVAGSPAARWLDIEPDKAGRLRVNSSLCVIGCERVYAAGDIALSDAWNGNPVPGLAPAAKQAGTYVARVIRSIVENRPAPPAFRYRHFGSLATIGRKAAVADFGVIKLWGAPAWWLWGIVHVGFLVGMRNRVTTMINWFWSYLTYKSSVRLITGEDRAEAAQNPLTS